MQVSVARCKLLLSVSLILTLLTGCELTNVNMPDWFTSNQKDQSEQTDMPPQPAALNATGLKYRPSPTRQATQDENAQQQAIWLTPKTLYRPGFTHKSLADYTEQLAMKLVSNSRLLNASSLVGVASFVELNSDLKTSSVVGNQIAELFIAEMQQFGVSVVDYKLAENINVLPQGDFVFSRDARELAEDMSLDYLLSGTLIRSEKGVRVNARIIAIKNRAVVSSATLTVPHFVIDELSPRFMTTVTASD